MNVTQHRSDEVPQNIHGARRDREGVQARQNPVPPHTASIFLVFAGTWIAAATVCGPVDATWVALVALPCAMIAVRRSQRIAVDGPQRIAVDGPQRIALDAPHRIALDRPQPIAVDPSEREPRIIQVESSARAVRQMAQADAGPVPSTAIVSAHARAQFLTEMSHELRTPMNGVLGMAELLAETQMTPEQIEYLDAVQRSGVNLLNLITDTLDLARIEAGELAIEPMAFDLHGLVEDAAQSSAGDADRRGLELVVHCAPDVPRHVIGDCGRIRQVLVNLCNNALKFTRQGSVVLEVTRSAAPGGGTSIAFSVTDTGIGISAEEQSRLFDRRTQAGASMTLRFGGTGRGLTVSRALVRLMKGDIRVESELEKGSRFVFELPLAVDDAALGRDRQRVDLGGRRALVVDDLEINRRLFRESLEAIGARCETAGSEEEALEIVRATRASGDPIAFAFIDFEMPDTNGTVLCHMIRRELEAASPRFVLMAAEKHRARTRTWQLAGFDACLQKPLRRSDLEDILKELLERDAEPRDSNAASKKSPANVRAAGAAGGASGQGQIHKDLLGLNVLIVEDNLVNQRVAERMLEKLGCNVTIADDGREALARCDQTPFDLVLMDCQMPVLDGFAATEELRKRERSRGTARMPIIALTANSTKGDRDQCLAAGMDDHLAKPIVRDELVAALTRWRPRLVDPYPALPSHKIGPQNPGVSQAPVVIRR